MLTRMWFIGICFCALILFGNVSFGYQENANRPGLACNNLTVDISAPVISYPNELAVLGTSIVELGVNIKTARLVLRFFLNDREQRHSWAVLGHGQKLFSKFSANKATITSSEIRTFTRELVREAVRDGLDKIALTLDDSCDDGDRSLIIGAVRPIEEGEIPTLGWMLNGMDITGMFSDDRMRDAIDMTGLISEIFLEELTPEYLESL